MMIIGSRPTQKILKARICNSLKLCPSCNSGKDTKMAMRVTT